MPNLSTDTKCKSKSALTHIIRTTRLKFFGHVARADPSVDYSRAVRARLESLDPVWPLCRGTSDRVIPGSGPLNPISHYSWLV